MSFYVFAWTVLMQRAVVGLGILGLAVSVVYSLRGRAGLRVLLLPLLLLAISTPMPGGLIAVVNYHLVGLASACGAAVESAPCAQAS